MKSKLAWVQLTAQHKNIQLSGSDFRVLEGKGVLRLRDVSRFTVFKRDFMEQYWDLIQTYEEVRFHTSVSILGYRGKFFINDEDLLIIVPDPCPDVVRAFRVVNAFGHRNENWLQQALLYAIDNQDNMRLLEVYWEEEWIPSWPNSEPSPALTDIVHTLIGSDTAPPHLVLDLYENYWSMEVKDVTSPRGSSPSTGEWDYEAENGDRISLKMYSATEGTYDVGVWINDKPIRPSEPTRITIGEYLADLTGYPLCEPRE
ncbi:MAG: hypothetical protein JSW61_03990 [Candidatus Thorarchaeota archaeon]|nr:MAG: hypothetical protein JSW61_03990 [Candidatus Thorarchaeota archaeon]